MWLPRRRKVKRRRSPPRISVRASDEQGYLFTLGSSSSRHLLRVRCNARLRSARCDPRSLSSVQHPSLIQVRSTSRRRSAVQASPCREKRPRASDGGSDSLRISLHAGLRQGRCPRALVVRLHRLGQVLHRACLWGSSLSWGPLGRVFGKHRSHTARYWTSILKWKIACPSNQSNNRDISRRANLPSLLARISVVLQLRHGVPEILNMRDARHSLTH